MSQSAFSDNPTATKNKIKIINNNNNGEWVFTKRGLDIILQLEGGAKIFLDYNSIVVIFMTMHDRVELYMK